MGYGMPKPKSKYDKRLRELGCVPYTEILSKADLEETDNLAESVVGTPVTKKTRKELRALIAQGLIPNFLTVGDSLYINDEVGSDWSGPLGIEKTLLKELHFKDLSTGLRAATNRLKRKMH